MMQVERGGIDVALLGQHGFQRAHAQLHLAQLRAVVVVVMVVVVVCPCAGLTFYRAGHGLRKRMIQYVVWDHATTSCIAPPAAEYGSPLRGDDNWRTAR